MGDVRGGYDEEDRLPWLEAVEEEEEPDGPGAGKLIGAVILGLVLLGAAVGGYFWLGQSGAQGDGQLIAAPAGDYKVKPDDPGGMDVEGKGDVTFAASEGAEPKARIDVGAVAEAPVAASRSKEEGPPPPEPGPPEGSLEGAPPQVTPPPAGGTIQLGAFSSEAAANSAWKALSGRFGYLEPLAHSVLPVTSGERTLYRLRASGPGAANICGRLRVAGETCVRVN